MCWVVAVQPACLNSHLLCGVFFVCFFSQARFIDPPRYSDVVEERSEAQHVCGYPPCANALGKVSSWCFGMACWDHTGLMGCLHGIAH